MQVRDGDMLAGNHKCEEFRTKREKEKKLIFDKNKRKVSKWYGVDLDGTLAEYHGWNPEIGEPIPKMVKRVKRWIDEGRDVRIFTARVSKFPDTTDAHVTLVRKNIEAWSLKHLGKVLPVTNIKEHGLVEFWDDRAVQVIKNTGRRVKWLKKK